MTWLRLYAPAIVLLALAMLSELGVGYQGAAYLVLAAAVWLHVGAERRVRSRK